MEELSRYPDVKGAWWKRSWAQVSTEQCLVPSHDLWPKYFLEDQREAANAFRAEHQQRAVDFCREPDGPQANNRFPLVQNVLHLVFLDYFTGVLRGTVDRRSLRRIASYRRWRYQRRIVAAAIQGAKPYLKPGFGEILSIFHLVFFAQIDQFLIDGAGRGKQFNGIKEAAEALTRWLHIDENLDRYINDLVLSPRAIRLYHTRQTPPPSLTHGL